MNRVKLLAIIFFAIPLLLLIVFHTTPTTTAAVTAEDPAATYKAKCAACHTANASKFYDPAKATEEHVQTILKGKKGVKPPFMPDYGSKGMTEDEARGLAVFMKSLRPAAS
jgi:mono/diheme cytochrome c family protein